VPLLDHAGDVLLLALLPLGVGEDLLDKLGRDDEATVVVRDDDVAGLDGSPTATDSDVDVPGDMDPAEDGRVGASAVDGQSGCGDSGGVADGTVGDEAGSAAGEGSESEDVAQGASGRAA